MLIYTVYLYIRSTLMNQNKISVEQLNLLENIVRYAVGYAEQIYKTDITIDRFSLASDYVYDVVSKLGYDYPELAKIIIGLIEAQVLQLPKTNTGDS